MRLGFDILVGLLAITVVAAGIDERALPYAFSGAKQATHLIEADLGPHDVVLLPGTSTFPYAVETHADVTLQATPERTIGYVPHFSDPRIVAVGGQSATPATPESIGKVVRSAQRVYVFIAIPFYGPEQRVVASTLAADGFVLARTIPVDATQVVVWRRPTAT